MKPSDPPNRDSATDSVDFGEWLGLIAESRGVSREEVLEQLISSYWTLNEMTEMIQEPEEGGQEEDPFARNVDGEFAPITRAKFEEYQAAVDDRLADFDQRLLGLRTELQTDDSEVTAEELDRRIDAEFATLRRILEHLIDKTERTEESIGALDDRISREVAELQRERSKVDKLRQQAMRLGVKQAECDYCETSVDLSLLPTPYCPGCGRLYADISPRSEFLGLGFGSHTLVSEQPRRDGRNRSSPRNQNDSEPSAREDNRITGFEWSDDRSQS